MATKDPARRAQAERITRGLRGGRWRREGFELEPQGDRPDTSLPVLGGETVSRSAAAGRPVDPIDGEELPPELEFLKAGA